MAFREGFAPQKAGALVALMAAAILGNYFSLNLFFGVDFLFGSIAALIVVSLFGVFWGGLTAVLAGVYTLVLWNHPYAMAIFSLEAIFIGLLLRCGYRNILLLDGLYWLAIGMPLVWVFYAYALGMEAQAVLLIVLKQSVNGLFNATLAQMLLMFSPLRRWGNRQTMPLMQVLFTLFAALVFLPVLSTSILQSRFEVAHIEDHVNENIETVRAGVDNAVGHWIRTKQQGVEELARQAGLIGLEDVASLQRMTEALARAFPDFHNMYVADVSATTRAFFPEVNEFGESTIGLNFADRDFVVQVLATGKLVVSNVVMGRGGVFVPFVGIAVPFFRDEKLAGYALGAIRLDRMAELLQGVRTNGPEVVLLDGAGRVVASTDASIYPLADVYRRSGRAIYAEDSSSYTEKPEEGTGPPMIRWRQSHYVKTAGLGLGLPWTVVFRQPIAPYRNDLYQMYIRDFLVVLLFAGLALGIARMVGARLARPIEELVAVTRDLPDQLDQEASIAWPESQVQEIGRLVENGKQTVHALAGAFGQLQQSQERYHQVIALTKGVIYERDREVDRFAFMGAEIESLTGYGLDEITPSMFISLILEREIFTDHRMDLPASGQTLWTEGESDWHVYRADYRIRTRDGAERWLSDHAVYLPNSQNPFTRSLGILQDITERKQLEERARQQAQLASVGQLAAGIAHDFNNILSVMMGLAETLNFRGDLPQAVRDDLRVIHEQGLRAAQLIRQILDFSRQTVAERKPLDVRALVEDTARLFRRTMPESIVIRVEGDAGRVFIRANQTQIQQVLTNLALNARDAMPEGGELTFRLRRMALSPDEAPPVPEMAPGDYVAIEVRDTGTGMTPEVLRHLYEPFFTTKPRDRGTGLGLAQVYGIVKQHNGEIAVESEPGRGTAFCLYFQEEQTSGEVPEVRPQSLPTGQGETVLVVEDDAGVMRVVLSLLKTLGYEALSAGNGREGLAVYRSHRDRIRVVLTDMVMPEMGGLAFLKALREENRELPVVVMSGYPLDEDGAGRLPEGVAGFLSKPLNLMEVAQTLARAVKG